MPGSIKAGGLDGSSHQVSCPYRLRTSIHEYGARRHCQSKFVYFAKTSEPDFTPAIPTTRTIDGEVQGHANSPKVCRCPCLDPQPLQPRPSPQPSRYLQTEPFCGLGRVASACSLNASDQHHSQARSGLSDNASAGIDLRRQTCPRLSVKQTSMMPSPISASDPQRTWGAQELWGMSSTSPRLNLTSALGPIALSER
jgi:hypothetical protein